MTNKIKSIKTYRIDDNTDGKGVLNAYEERDVEGIIVLNAQYDENGDFVQKAEKIINEKGQLIEEKQFTNEEKPDQHFLYEYNESGKVAQATVHYLDGSISFRRYSRDEAENITTIEIKDDENNFEGREVRRFDSEGRVLEEAYYDEENEIAEKTETEYDDFGRIIETVFLDSEGIETVRFYDYYTDDKGRVNKIETLDEDEVIIRVDEIEYDERGNQSKYIILDKSRGITFNETWEHDQQNRITNHKRNRGEQLLEEVKNRYRDDGLIAEIETLTGDGVTLNYFEYEFH